MIGKRILGSLLLAAFAALALAPTVVVLGPILGAAIALRLYLVAAAGGYLMVIADSRRQALAAALTTGVLGGIALLLVPGLGTFVLSLAVILALIRSGYLWPSPHLRGVVTELALVGGGLLLAGELSGPTPLKLSFALWAFFLVQAIYFLLRAKARHKAPAGDAFASARDRAQALMDEWA